MRPEMVGIADAHGVAAADRLALLQRGEQKPVQVRMAEVLLSRRELPLTGRLSAGAGRSPSER